MAVFIPDFRRQERATSPLEQILSGLMQGGEHGYQLYSQAQKDKEERAMNELKKSLLGAQTKAATQKSKQYEILENLLSGKNLNDTEEIRVSGDIGGDKVTEEIRDTQKVSSPGLSYGQMAAAGKLLGVGEPQIVDVDGSKYAISPFGKTLLAKGMTEKDKVLAKKEGERIDEIRKENSNLSTQDRVLNQAQNIIANPTFQKMRTYAGEFPQTEMAYYKKFGTAEEKRLAGRFEDTVNRFVLDSMKAFGSRPAVAEMQFLRGMKISDRDTLEVAQGKLQSALLFNNSMQKINDLTLNYIGQGLNPYDAERKAIEEVDVKKLDQKIGALIDGSVAATAKKYGITEDEVLRKVFGD